MIDQKQVQTAAPIPLSLSVLPFAVVVAGLLAAHFWLDVPLYVGLVAGWAVACAIALWCGRGVWSTGVGTYRGLKSTFFVIGILLMIAALISSWMSSGTVPGMIWYGIQLVRPEYLVVTVFLLTGIGSMALGSSVGTLSTMGAALAGIGAAFEIPAGLIGGALICGAMIGDRVSPVSGTFHLVAGMTGTKAEDNYRPMWQTGFPMLIVSAGLFAWLGYGKATGPGGDPLSNPLVLVLLDTFAMPWYVLVPPAVVLALALFRVKILRSLSVGIFAGVLLTVTVQDASLPDALRTIWLGYDLTAEGRTVLHGGGVWPMLNMALLILFAGAMNGVMELSGMLETIIGRLLERIRRIGSLLLLTMGMSVAMGMLGCNQSISVIVPGRALRGTYDRMGVPPRYLVRAIADSGVVSSPLIPWNLHGILCSTAIGIATATYLPYAFYLWGLITVTFLSYLVLNFRKNQIKLDK
ncbi:hypothetical protein OS242_17120 [Tumebacillus sp. DT12]|uniref:Na+/H+ antiporter NhaC-like C-terminal domain-containing protein n=1 Tax=Tumebacillus lacus TaxID=2995335 RepID=A0ABT3X442_9BACL|nr:Na+/H+ antiporter NhaC family protein [Tumebacillus lacus]MCX7571666.1 hypothetical protein [Tumebacillus lacus]